MLGGQFHSVYDVQPQDAEKRPGFLNQHYPPQPVESAATGHRGATPVEYNPAPPPANSALFGVLTITLRILQLLFSIIGFAIMAASKQTEANVSFADFKAFVGVLSLDAIVCLYAIVQLVISFILKAVRGSFISSSTSGACFITFILDTVLAHALGAACGAAAAVASLIDSVFNSTKDLCGTFCPKVDGAVAISFLAWVILVLSTVLYAVRLFMALHGSKLV